MENVVYETFEADKPKYDLYRDAIKKSIAKISAVNCHIAVVGAGRGGLVEASLDAIRSLVDPDITTRFTITCVEKNRFAAISLNHKLLHKWNMPNTPKIVIENIDMRDWRPDQKVDVLVSELLGSLGDNEASPECLNASVMELLSPARGVSIPHRYFSSLEPVSAHKAWSQVRDMKKFQMPLVTLFHTHSRPSVQGPKMLFEFVHARDSAANELEQSRSLTWTMAYDTCIHGFAGYFHCDLDEEGECVMSIDPRTATPRMVSWFPAFLPLQTPVYVQQGATVQVFVRRRSTKSRMWIEWTLIEPFPQPTNNLDGTFHSVGLI
jgi:protein arginine N-methyltransferase 5